MTTFRFPVDKARRVKKPVATHTGKIPLPKTTIGTIQGMTPGSKEEWFAAVALSKLGFTYTYQASIAGGRSVRGGQIIDFLVNTVPIPRAVYILGEYWHTGQKGKELLLQIADMEAYYKGQIGKTVMVWTADIPNIESAVSVFRDQLGTG